MEIQERLKLLARRIPGVAGYQDQESSRDTDKLVRLRLADTLDGAARSLEEIKRGYVERKLLTQLPQLESLSSKLNRTANEIRYASRGYRGFFDRDRVDQRKLDRLYQFDLDLVDEVEKIRALSVNLGESEESSLGTACTALSREIDSLGALFASRQHILNEELAP